MSKGIKMSPKYGVNPSMTVCYWCGETTGIALMGKIGDGRKHEDFEAPKYCFGGYEPCDKCKENMAVGVTLMEASTSETFNNQPPMQKGIFPTGRWVVMKPESAKRIFPNIGEATKAFIDCELFEQITKGE